MKQCAFLTMANMEAFECYDHLLYEPLANLGWNVTPIPWRDNSVNWADFEVIIIRSPWDYQQDPDLFMNVLKKIDASPALLENSLDIIQWNIDKTYLRDIQKKGIPIVPTLWHENLTSDDFPAFFDKLEHSEIIIKPVISANADDTFWLSSEVDRTQKQKLQTIFTDRPLMVQPFIQNVITEGEFSLFYFGGTYSHTILKTPKQGDFRVQEEHGGRLMSIEPEPELLSISNKTMEALPETPLYARVDFVRNEEGHFNLMELELIEPSLYFNMDSDSPKRFATQFNQWMKNKESS